MVKTIFVYPNTGQEQVLHSTCSLPMIVTPSQRHSHAYLLVLCQTTVAFINIHNGLIAPSGTTNGVSCRGGPRRLPNVSYMGSRRDDVGPARIGRSRRQSLLGMGAKKRNRNSHKNSEETNWYEDEEHSDPRLDEAEASAGTSTSNTVLSSVGQPNAAGMLDALPPQPPHQSPSSEITSHGAGGGGHSPRGSDEPSIVSSSDDDYLAPDPHALPLEDEEWDVVESGHQPLVEKYGLDARANDFDELDLLNLDISEIVDDGVPSTTAFAGVDSEAPATWQNSMEVPDDDVDTGSGFQMRRELDEMLMERAIRFYDPKVRVALPSEYA